MRATNASDPFLLSWTKDAANPMVIDGKDTISSAYDTPGKSQISNLKFLLRASFLQNGAKSGFEMCFDIGSQHLGCWGQNTSPYAQGCDLS